jgi:DNA polymerase
MQTEAEHAEFLALLKAAQEQLTYLKELGVEGTEKHCAEPVNSRLISDQPGGPHVPTTPSHQAAATATTPDSLFGDLSSPPLRIQQSSETFEEIWADIGDCTRCPLYQGRTNIVHTDGNRKARLMFVGEAPGADEDEQARPFVGRAGQLLTKIIEAIGLKREEVLIGNVNRCRPPANRPPTPEEASMCKPFLLREIAAVQPEVIVVLGNTAMKNLLDLKQGITRVRGQFQDYQGLKVMPTFHPAYLLRDPTKKKETWEDIKKVRDYLDSTRKQES